MIATFLQSVQAQHFQLYPGSIFMLLIFVLLFVFVFRHGLTFEGLIATANTLGSQPMAILILVLGLAALKMCHDMDIDTNVAAGIIGCALGLLNNQFAKQHTETTTTNTDPPTITKTVTSDVGSPSTASNPPEVK